MLLLLWSYPICFYCCGFRMCSVLDSLGYPAVKSFKWIHPCTIDRTKPLYPFSNMSDQMHCNYLMKCKIFYFIYVCMYVYIYVYVRMCVYVRKYVCMYVCMYVCTYVRMHICMYVCTYVRKYVYVYVYMYVCMCMYVCTCVCIYILT